MTEIEPRGRAAGGYARAKNLSAERRSEISKVAAAARWDTAPVREVRAGSPDRPLMIGGVEIECYVLDDETRVITQASMLQGLGRSRRAAGVEDRDDSLPPILQGKAIRDYIPDSVIAQAQPIRFRLPGGGRANGYRADILPTLCEIYLSARSEGKLPKNQMHIAQQAEVLVRGLAHVGIIALVDEATGFQETRTKDALAQILEAFVTQELQPWVKTFPNDFYKELFRLREVEYDPRSVHRPKYFGHLTNDIVYKRLAPGVLAELKKEQKKRQRSGRLFQSLTTDVGYPKLREHLGSVVTLMKLSTNWGDFKAKIDMIHPVVGVDALMPLWTDDSELGL